MLLTIVKIREPIPLKTLLNLRAFDRASTIPVNLSGCKCWRFVFPELGEAITQNPESLQLGFRHI